MIIVIIRSCEQYVVMIVSNLLVATIISVIILVIIVSNLLVPTIISVIIVSIHQ